jgi:hypothetical protein
MPEEAEAEMAEPMARISSARPINGHDSRTSAA